eukprot:8770908-Pyramimonas_sp.AAC.1
MNDKKEWGADGTILEGKLRGIELHCFDEENTYPYLESVKGDLAEKLRDFTLNMGCFFKER